MNLSLGDLRELPLAAALLSPGGDVIACTPEWQGAGPGSAAYPVRRNRLVVCATGAAPACGELLERLLAELDAAAAAAQPPQAQRVRMLAAALRLVAGRTVAGSACASGDVLELARIGIEARTGLRVELAQRDTFDVCGGDAAALVLVQLAVNAERHSHADLVTLSAVDGALRVVWRGDIAPGPLPTARRRGDRARWGLGFARIAGDAIGGVVHAPHCRDDGALVAALELGVGRLTLPLAAVRDHRVVRATRAWDEETGALPGTAISAVAHAVDALAAAARERGAIVHAGGLSARAARDLVWFAVPPDDVADRARDVLDGLTHERALTEGIDEPRRSLVSALAQLLGFALGTPIQRVPGTVWVRRMRELAGPFGLAQPIPDYDGLGAADPAVCALLAAEAGAGFEVEGDTLWLRLRDRAMPDPVAVPLLAGDMRRIRLG